MKINIDLEKLDWEWKSSNTSNNYTWNRSKKIMSGIQTIINQPLKLTNSFDFKKYCRENSFSKDEPLANLYFIEDQTLYLIYEREFSFEIAIKLGIFVDHFSIPNTKTFATNKQLTNLTTSYHSFSSIYYQLPNYSYSIYYII